MGARRGGCDDVPAGPSAREAREAREESVRASPEWPTSGVT